MKSGGDRSESQKKMICCFPFMLREKHSTRCVITLKRDDYSDEPSTSAAAENKSLQERQECTPARFSVTLKTASDLGSLHPRCNETISIEGEMQLPALPPAYNVIKPIVKQPPKQQQNKPIVKQPRKQQQKQQPLLLIPAYPNHSGLSYHIREADLQRVLQQSGFGSRRNMTAIPATATANAQGPCTCEWQDPGVVGAATASAASLNVEATDRNLF